MLPAPSGPFYAPFLLANVHLKSKMGKVPLI
jgi:hypothetical protein